MYNDSIKAGIVPYLPEILSTGHSESSMPVHFHPDVSAFHSFSKSVPTPEGPKKAIVDVAERLGSEPKFIAYNLTREGTANYEYRNKQKESASSSPIPGQDRGNLKTPTHGSDAAFERNIAPFFEVVNIRFANEE